MYPKFFVVILYFLEVKFYSNILDQYIVYQFFSHIIDIVIILSNFCD